MTTEINSIEVCKLVNSEKSAADLRVDTVNELIKQIASHGRMFFETDGNVSFMSRGDDGKIWFHDSCTGKKIYTHYRGLWKEFSHGGTLRNLVEQFRNYIVRGNRISINYICPKQIGGQSNIWGYTNEEAGKLINAVKHLPIFGVKQ